MPNWIKSISATVTAAVSGVAAAITTLLGSPAELDVTARLVIIFISGVLAALLITVWSYRAQKFNRGLAAMAVTYALTATAAYCVPRYHGLLVSESLENRTTKLYFLSAPHSSSPNVRLNFLARNAQFDPAGFEFHSGFQPPKLEIIGPTPTTATILLRNFKHPQFVFVRFKLRRGVADDVKATVEVEGAAPLLRGESLANWSNPYVSGGLLWLVASALLLLLRFL